MHYIGIDPGGSGAIVFLDEDKILNIYDVPITTSLYGSGMSLNPVLFSDILADCISISGTEKICIAIEQVSAMPNQGVSSTFKFGVSFGIIQGAVAAMKLPAFYIKPVEWKKHFGLVSKDKDASRTLALQMYPLFSKDFKYKKSNGKSDALLIALYLRDKQNGIKR